MSSKSEGVGSRACWFVGAAYSGGTDDQTPRFIEEGIWQNGYQDKYLEVLKSIQPGDRIAIKSSYVRKHNLPFDNNDQTVSVMAIKATGTVKENLGDGRNLNIDWTRVDPPREWYFYTNRSTVWRVLSGDWATDALISFTFEGKAQDIDRFRNAPYWRERFGDGELEKRRFIWTRFYEAVADKLIAFRNKRENLVAGIHAISTRVSALSNLHDKFKDGTTGPLQDICPFTTMGIFNRGITEANRKIIASELAKFLGVVEPVPYSFEGIPLLNNQKSWFFGFDKDREPKDIDTLWQIFAEAIRFAESDDADSRSAFMRAYDNATRCLGVGWNLTMGLYWIRPWNFPTLDVQSQSYITKKLAIQIDRNGPKGRCNANDYLSVLDRLETRFQEDAYPVHSFPDLSLAAYLFKDGSATDYLPAADPDTPSGNVDSEQESVIITSPIESYSIDDILAEGCFIERFKLEKILECLRIKKNLILQGPPGTGKTWLAKRLAFAFMGQRNDSKLRVMQFHPNLSYEDFVRGWRPAGEGKLNLVDGPFMEMIKVAAKDPKVRHVVIIEEINRGNPAQIFGEMLTLLEADKRNPNEALELCYRQTNDERVFIPDNLYVIGTMNIADRSIALVDLALRRRFSFIDLEPTFGKVWQEWVHNQFRIEPEILVKIEERVRSLNNEITKDMSLGPQFRVGHSYVTPPIGASITDSREWFKQVVETEIGPLLDEYWFDALERAQKVRDQLLEGF